MIKRLVGSAALGVAILTAAFALHRAQGAGVVEAEEARRLTQIAIGLGFAAYANFLPKQRAPTDGSPRAHTWTQSVLRFGGWSMTLAGLAYAALWMFAPLAVADPASLTVVTAAVTALLGYTVWAYLSCRRPAAGS